MHGQQNTKFSYSAEV